MKGRNKKNNGQRGAALVVSIFAVLIVTVLGFAMVSSALISRDVTTAARDQSSAYYLSEAGLTHAIALVKTAGASQFTNILRAGDGVANTGDELSTQTADPIPAAGISLATGSYQVFVLDDPDDADGNPNADSNGKLIIRSIGTANDGATATSEAVVYSVVTGRVGILADGDIVNTNVLTVTGPTGDIHANGTYSSTSTACVNARLEESSNASIDTSKVSSGVGCGTAGAIGVNVFTSTPKVTPDIWDLAYIQATFHPQADYILKVDGNIYRKGSVSPMTSAEKTLAGLNGWSYGSSAKLWSYSSSTLIPNAVYYFEATNAKITNGGGSGLLNAPTVSMISEGSISITNGPYFQPKLPGISLVSANDIQITSTFGGTTNPGLVYAYGQMEVTNQSVFYGWLEAANFRQADGTNGLDVNDVGGGNLVSRSSKGTLRLSNKTTVNTPSGSALTSTFLVTSRREVRN